MDEFKKYSEYTLKSMTDTNLFPPTEVLDLITPVDGVALDIGFGNGQKTFELAKKVKTVLAMDVVEIMKEYAEKNYYADNITYSISDIANIDFPENYFDVIHSQFCFFYILDKKSLFEKIYKCLKPGGQFIFADLTSLDKNPPIDYDCQRISTLDYIDILSELKFSNILFVKEENLKIDKEYSNQFYNIIKCSK